MIIRQTLIYDDQVQPVQRFLLLEVTIDFLEQSQRRLVVSNLQGFGHFWVRTDAGLYVSTLVCLFQINWLIEIIKYTSL